ncbi:MAG: DUF5606 domain-containing protein [Bacteroidales bacterium]|nr:DUF5606 domain-containing protein [Bacteroidales bacterium]
MLKKILSISGRPGLFKLVSQGKNMLIVENIATGKRCPAYARDKVISLGDIAIYTNDEDVPLYDVLESVKTKAEGKPVDVKALGDDVEVRKWFYEVLPDFDQDRVYTNDIRKLLQWYNQLIAAGITSFKPEEAPAEDEKKEDVD